ncbi:MAG: RnfABCDGE type electron transport complex subunit D [Candidatus Dormibacteraeota bacterium]|nr:RnfABCDGE type electron transport complex subunit D [Candidatus Dormibacteraeota bacterium]
MLDRLPHRFSELLLKPQTAPDTYVFALALLPSIVGGILLFKEPAVLLLGLAVGVGCIAQIPVLFLKRFAGGAPLLSAVVATALVGPNTPLLLVAGLASAAAAAELLRARFLPSLRFQVGLAAYAAVVIATQGAPAAYLRPDLATPAPEPIRLWLEFYGGRKMPIDITRLYLGNVAGPVFATSLLAQVLGAAWLWYARRLSLVAVLGSLIAGTAVTLAFGWAPGYQLVSGPLWFGLALLLGDRLNLPRNQLLQLLAGLLGGGAALAVRSRGYAIEGSLVAVAAVQLASAVVSAGARGLAASARPKERLLPPSARSASWKA